MTAEEIVKSSIGDEAPTDACKATFDEIVAALPEGARHGLPRDVATQLALLFDIACSLRRLLDAQR